MHPRDGAGGRATATTGFSPVGALGAFSPRSMEPYDDRDVIGLHRPGGGLPGYWTTAEEDALSRFFLAHSMPSLADPAQCRSIVRAFQRQAELRNRAASSELDDKQDSQNLWQHDLHAALMKFSGQKNGCPDVRSHDELLQQAWGNENAFLDRTILPPPSQPDGDADGSRCDAFGINTLLPPPSPASSLISPGISLAHTLLPPAVTERTSGCDHAAQPNGWCRHVTIAEDHATGTPQTDRCDRR